jgi:mannosylglycerate hydrolase
VPRPVAVVPHTHWDREWYAPFPAFRQQLVELLDGLLPSLEADPSCRHFLLDGQMAMVDDYLAVRPEAASTLRRLNGAGRISLGPWYVLMDEFLVSGETIVRNLQLGLERAAALGGAMDVGYLPDMFGHVAQVPQLLRLAGIEHAVVWRGVPAAVEGTAFRWTALDGSSVRAEYLATGYHNGMGMPPEPDVLLTRIRRYVDELGPRLDGGPLLWMNGSDHTVPEPWIGRVVAEADARAGDLDLRVTSLVEHLAAAPPATTEVRGELRSGARANLLAGTTSNRVDVKQAAAAAERALERRAEPLCALFVPPDRWPAALLEEAWLAVVRNAAHDSICACSADEVVDAVLHRYAEARATADGLAVTALRWVGLAVGAGGPVAVNATGRARSGVVELVVPGTDPIEGAQVVGERRAALYDRTAPGRDLAELLAPLHVQEVAPDTYVVAVRIDEQPDRVDVAMRAGADLIESHAVAEQRLALEALAASRPETPFRVVVTQEPSQRVLVRVADVPALGWAAWSPGPLDVPPVTASGTELANGLVTVAVDPGDGTFSIDGHAGLGRLVDGGDRGDTYTYDPPQDDRVVDAPESVHVEVAEAGPVRGRLVVTATYRWPHGLAPSTQARAGERQVEVRTTLELRAGERALRVTTELDNIVRDHRLRVHLPLPSRAATSVAETAFGAVERGTAAEGGPTERPLPTFPSRRFVSAGGVTVVHDGLQEYELVDVDGEGTAGELALTLLRCTGLLSRVEVGNRPLPAGPAVPLEGPQLAGRRTLRWAVAVGDDVDPWALADDVLLPLDVVEAGSTGHQPARGSALEVTGAEVSAVVRRAGALEVRVHNPSTEATTVSFPGRSGWLVDLRGRALEPFDGAFPLGPWAIATARVREDSG